MKIGKFLAGSLIALSAAPSVANASVIIASKCSSVASSSGCLFSGNISGNTKLSNSNSYNNAKLKYNIYNNVFQSAGPDIDLNYLFDTSTTPGLITGASKSSGTWSTPGYAIDYIAVKAGDYFSLYKVADLSSGSWSTKNIPYSENPKKLSHIVFFGQAVSAGAVPEPASWAMLIEGVGMAGGALRRRRSQHSALTAA